MKTKKKSNRKAEQANIYLEIAKNVIEIIVYTIAFIISDLIDTYRNSCELRFVRNWKLDKLYVGQYEYATFEENGHTFEFTNEFDEDDEWY